MMPKKYQKHAEKVLDMLDQTSLCRIRSVLYVLKPAKRADFQHDLSRFVNFLMLSRSVGVISDFIRAEKHNIEVSKG